jgi:hypothetical protein
MSHRSFALMIAGSALALSALSCNDDKGTGPPAAKELDSPYLLGATTGSQNYIHAFADEGAYPYHCKLHTTAQHRMGGTVFVSPTGADSAFIRIFEGAFDPISVTVRPNGQVRWQNFDDGTHHTVTSD